jgi:hypothetical protein
VSNPYLASWIQTALRHEEVNAELLEIIFSLLAWIHEKEDLLAFAEAEIAARFPDGEAA